IIIEPDTHRLGWGVAKYAVTLQQIDVTPDKDDSRSLLILTRPDSFSNGTRLGAARPKTSPVTLRCVFDDHIRSMAAKQRLLKGKKMVKQKKMNEIAKLIELQIDTPSSNGPRKSISRTHSNCFNSTKYPVKN